MDREERRQQEEDVRGKDKANLGNPSGPRWTGIGFYMGNQQESYDAELFATVRGIHHLASWNCSGRDFTILTDSQAAASRIQSDDPGPGQGMATEIVGLANTLHEPRKTLT